MVLDCGDYFEGDDLREVMRHLFDFVHVISFSCTCGVAYYLRAGETRARRHSLRGLNPN